MIWLLSNIVDYSGGGEGNLLPEKMTQTFITTETIMDTDSTMVNITHRFVHT